MACATLSARSASALDTLAADVAAYLKQHADANLADVAFTLQTGRKSFSHRLVLGSSGAEDAAGALETLDPGVVFKGAEEVASRPVVFMFSGQGAQYVNMGLGLYTSEPLFREWIDRCSEILGPHLGLDLRDVLYPSEKEAEAAARLINQTCITQPALFISNTPCLNC